MLPDNFNFAMLPSGSNDEPIFTLKEVGMLASTIENIDQSVVAWIKEDLSLSARTNEGFTNVPVLWQAPERAYQIKHEKALRDDGGSLKLPLVSVERTNIIKDPQRKGSFQAQLYSDKYAQRSGRIVLARRIVPDKTRNFAVAAGTRTNTGAARQRYFPRTNKKVVVQFLSAPIPVYINAEYKISLRTEYQSQMNSLMSPFLARTGQINAVVLKRNGHLYEAFIDQTFAHNNTVAAMGDEMRMFTTDITIRVLGYLMGEGDNDDRPILTLEENAVEVTFPSEGPVPAGNTNLFGDSS